MDEFNLLLLLAGGSGTISPDDATPFNLEFEDGANVLAEDTNFILTEG